MAIDTIADVILDRLTPDEVESVYDGIAGRCACGCSGRYYGPGYSSELTKATNELMVQRILKRTQRRSRKASAGEVDQLWTYTYSDGSRSWAYQTKTRLIMVRTKAGKGR